MFFCKLSKLFLFCTTFFTWIYHPAYMSTPLLSQWNSPRETRTKSSCRHDVVRSYLTFDQVILSSEICTEYFSVGKCLFRDYCVELYIVLILAKFQSQMSWIMRINYGIRYGIEVTEKILYTYIFILEWLWTFFMSENIYHKMSRGCFSKCFV